MIPVVNTLVLAGRVLPAWVTPGMVVLFGLQRSQPMLEGTMVSEGAVLAAIVLPAMTVVPVNSSAVVPSSVAGIALPTPLLVHGVGIAIVVVLGVGALVKLSTV